MEKTKFNNLRTKGIINVMIDMLKNIVILLGIGLILTNCNSKKELSTTEKRPNVLVILADDFGVQDMSFVGSSFYETPNLDRLAAKGMVFTQGYAASAVCSPSRATIMTGKFTARHGITDWIGEKSGEDWREMNRFDKMLPAEYIHKLPKSETTIAETMKANGYKTFFAGKWHLGKEGSYPEDHGFDINKGGWESGSPKGGYFAPYINPKLENKSEGENLSMRLALETVDFMKQNKDSSFFTFLSFYAVHGPIETTQEKWNKYRKKAIANGVADNGFVMEKKLPIRQTQDNPVYAGLVEAMDDAIGVVLDGLESLGLEDNTIVIFTSDNGGVSSGDSFSTSNLPLRGGKGYQWEGGIREPYLVYVPGKNSNGSKNDYPVTGADIYPTILDYANIKLLPQQHVDGVSLKPIIDEGSVLAERPLYWHYPHYGNQGGDPSSIIRQGNWKLIHYYEEDTDELYNLQDDPSEQHNVADSFPEITNELSAKLKNWLKSVNAKYPVKDEQFNIAKRAAYDTKTKTVLLPKLEKDRMDFLSEDFEPNKDWWGSKVTKD